MYVFKLFGIGQFKHAFLLIVFLSHIADNQTFKEVILLINLYKLKNYLLKSNEFFF